MTVEAAGVDRCPKAWVTAGDRWRCPPTVDSAVPDAVAEVPAGRSRPGLDLDGDAEARHRVDDGATVVAVDPEPRLEAGEAPARPGSHRSSPRVRQVAADRGSQVPRPSVPPATTVNSVGRIHAAPRNVVPQ